MSYEDRHYRPDGGGPDTPNTNPNTSTTLSTHPQTHPLRSGPGNGQAYTPPASPMPHREWPSRSQSHQGYERDREYPPSQGYSSEIQTQNQTQSQNETRTRDRNGEPQRFRRDRDRDHDEGEDEDRSWISNPNLSANPTSSGGMVQKILTSPSKRAQKRAQREQLQLQQQQQQQREYNPRDRDRDTNIYENPPSRRPPARYDGDDEYFGPPSSNAAPRNGRDPVRDQGRDLQREYRDPPPHMQALYRDNAEVIPSSRREHEERSPSRSRHHDRERDQDELPSPLSVAAPSTLSPHHVPLLYPSLLFFANRVLRFRVRVVR